MTLKVHFIQLVQFSTEFNSIFSKNLSHFPVAKLVFLSMTFHIGLHKQYIIEFEDITK